MTNRAVILLLLAAFLHGDKAMAESVALKFDKAALEQKWQGRIRSFLANGVIPLIDLESSMRKSDGKQYLKSR